MKKVFSIDLKKMPIGTTLNRLLLFCAMLISLTSSNAQQNLPGGYKHIIEVKRYSDWGKGYLTIINGAQILDESIEPSQWVGPFTYVSLDGEMLNCKDLILEVDGVSAKNWSEDMFYNTIDGRTDTIRIKIRKKGFSDEECTRPVIYDTLISIIPLYDYPPQLEKYRKYGGQLYVESARKCSQITPKYVDSFKTRKDDEFDFFPVMSYDIAPSNDNPLLDKEILKEMEPMLRYGCIMVKVTENPDIIFTVAKSVDESITTTYVPPSSRTVYTGSTTTPSYGALTGRYMGSSTKQHSYTVREGGYTEETKTADLFLEITALDAKKINDPNQTYPPIVWQTTAKRHLSNYNFDLEKELKVYASYMSFPVNDRRIDINFKRIIYAGLGVIAKSDNHVIDSVIPGMLAESAGLQPGDKLIKVDALGFAKKQKSFLKKSVKRWGWNSVYFGFEKYCVTQYCEGPPTCIFEILRDDKKQKITIVPQKLTFYSSQYF